MHALKTRIIQIDSGRFGEEHLLPVCEVLKQGGVILYPTETFYGLGADCFSLSGIRRIYALKSRSFTKPLSLVVSDFSMLRQITPAVPAASLPLADRFWPGPLTLVFRASPELPGELLAGKETVAVRIPGLEWLRELIRCCGFPLTSTSANLSGEASISNPRRASALFEGKVDMIVDGGTTPGGSPSTIVDFSRSKPRILREGAISSKRIYQALI